MASRDDVERFAQANRDVRALVLRDLRAFFAVLSSDAVNTRNALEEFMPRLVQQYGEIAATVAADFFDGLRDDAPVQEDFKAVMAEPVESERVRASTRWAIAPLFTPTIDSVLREAVQRQALSRLEQVADRFTLEAGRRTVVLSAASDPAKPKWARVPVGPTCAYCLIYASRGAVYTSRETALYKHGSHDKYHDFCNCTPTAFWEGQEYPEGYDPEALYATYEKASENANTSGIKPVAKELRENFGLS